MTDLSPENVLDDRDPGDDTLRRYRYQATYAAILAVRIAHQDPGTPREFVEVFCEHHDDILLKLPSGRFQAVQVKTQQLGGNPFKSSDVEVKTALGKFVSKQMAFANSFERFLIVTNHQFFRKDNKASLFHLVEKAEQATGPDPGDMDKGLSGFINSFLKEFNRGRKTPGRASREHALSVLKKLRVDDSLPKLPDIHSRLREVIKDSHSDYRVSTYADLERAANALSQMAYLRSSLPNDGASYLYLAYADNPGVAESKAIIDAKRISSADVSDLLAREIADCPILVAADPVDPSTLPADLPVAEKKMTAGGLSATTVAAARDWRASTEYLQRQWAAKLGEQPAVERYNAVATAVQTACSEAHEVTRCEDLQGPKMLEQLKTSLKRKKMDGTEFFNCKEEHLLGHAVIRTAQCKVWWSKEFDVN